MNSNPDYDEDAEYVPKKPNVGKGSYLDNKPKKPTPGQFEKTVKEIEAKKTRKY